MEPQRTSTADTLPPDDNMDANSEQPLLLHEYHAEYVLESFNEFYRTGKFCDLTLVAGVDQKR